MRRIRHTGNYPFSPKQARREAVCRICREYALGDLVEVGVAEGKLSRMLLALETTSTLLLVDNWRVARGRSWEDQRRAKEKLFELARKEPTLAIIPEDHVMAALKCRDSKMDFDFVFIDIGDTARAVKEAVDAWKPLVRHGGVLAGDRFRKYAVQRFVKENFKDYLTANDSRNEIWYWVNV